MKMRIETGKPLNLNDQLNAISKGLLLEPNKKYLPTPKANCGNGAGEHGQGGIDLQTAVRLWPTPTAPRNNSGPSKDDKHPSLDRAVQMWPTPDVRGFTNKGSLQMLAEAADSKKEFSGMAYRAGSGKKRKIWATPTANDAKNSLTDSQIGRGTLSAHLVETENISGGQLNADWVEILMGYPLYWTDINKDAIFEKDLPAAWLDGTWEEGIPRVVTGQKNRNKRLKGLGNAVVPQIPELIFMLIARVLWAA